MIFRRLKPWQGLTTLQRATVPSTPAPLQTSCFMTSTTTPVQSRSTNKPTTTTARSSADASLADEIIGLVQTRTGRSSPASSQDTNYNRQNYRGGRDGGRPAQQQKQHQQHVRHGMTPDAMFQASYELMSFMGFRPHAGDVYSPQDLTPDEARHYFERSGIRKRENERDLIAESGVNPRHLYRNFRVLESWRLPSGRIKSRKANNCSPVNQRRLSKAVRRAVGLGILPSVHAHPEILARELKATSELGPVEAVMISDWTKILS